MESNQLTLPAVFYNSVEKYAGNTSVVFAGECNFTYADLKYEVEHLAELLRELGINQGDKIAILSGNMPNWGIAYFAISLVGAVAVPILPDFHNDEISHILEHSEARILFVSENLYDQVKDEAPNFVERLILIDCLALIPKYTPADHLNLLTSSVSMHALKFVPAKVNEHDVASIFYTSGTTGSSKGVMLTHKNLCWTAQQSRSMQPVVETDRFLSILPLSHTLENDFGFLLAMMYGASVHYLRKPPVPSVLLPAMQKVRPTVILAVPLIIEKIYRTKIQAQFQKNMLMRMLSSFAPTRKVLHRLAVRKIMKNFGGKLKFFGIGGAKVDVNVERFMKEGKLPYGIGYGLTETSPMLAGAVGKHRKMGSTGIALEGVSLRIADPDPVTKVGEIQVKGANVMKGYYKAPELTREAFTADGWFKTGDRGLFDSQSRLYIKGRIKTMIVGASGENIYPEDIESKINKMRYVLESLVIEKKGKLVAMIHLNMDEIEEQFEHLKNEAQQYISEKSDEILNEIHQKVNTQLNKFSRINQVVQHPLPFERTPTRKIKRFLYI